MYLEVKQWPESQEVMEDPDWFFIQNIDNEIDSVLGSSAYAREINLDLIISEAIIVERKRIIKGLEELKNI